MQTNHNAGRRARVYYKGGVTGQPACDDCSQGEPVEVVLGVGDLPKGMDDAFLDMKVGEERTIEIPSDKAYGAHDPDGVQTYPRSYQHGFENLHVGDVITWTNPASGKQIPVRVIECDSQLVTLDFNHPLAGEDLTYWLKLVSLD